MIEGRLVELSGFGPEDVIADGVGAFIVGMDGGRIARVDPGSGTEEILAETGGRPLGLERLPDGDVLICDARLGLLRLDRRTSAITTLVSQVDGIPLRFCSNVTAASDGTLWFTESSTRFDFDNHMAAFLEQRGSGRLIRRDPDGRLSVVLRNLDFANGITLTDDEGALVFAETSNYSLNRFWLKGPRAGSWEVIAGNLPGFPDNLSRCAQGRFWVAMVRPRSGFLDRLASMPPFLRQALWRFMPRGGVSKPVVTWAMEFDVDGNVLTNLRAKRADFGSVTGVAQSAGKLAMVSPQAGSMLVIDRPHG